MKKSILLLITCLVLSYAAEAQERTIIGKETGEWRNFKVTGRVIDDLTGESLPGATIIIAEREIVQVTNNNGNFYVELTRADYTLEVRYVGYETQVIPFRVINDGRILVRLNEDDLQLDDLVIFGRNPEDNIKSTSMGSLSLSMSTMKEMPQFMGEIDVIKSMATLPGVSQVGEASAGFNVRGGGPDQNLILFAGAPIYNPAHLFGVFTAFNPDAISNVTLNKAMVPTKYGGRGSSILDIQAKNGSLNEWSGNVMLSTFSGKGHIEGPIVKDRVSVFLSGRGSYINWLLGELQNPDLRNSQANFNDVNAIVTGSINDNNLVTYSFYNSYDDFGLASDTIVSWTNRSHSLKWQSSIGEKFDLDATLYHTIYDFSIFNQSGINDFDLESGIRDTGARLIFNYRLNERNTFTVGADAKALTVQPGELIPGEGAGILPQQVQTEYGREGAAFIQHDIELSEKLAFSYGARYNMYQYLGERTVNQYEEFRPRNSSNVIGEQSYGPGEIIQSYDGLAPRASFRYSLTPKSSIKAGYNKMYQFIHLISNTATIAPTDFWKLSDEFLLPQEVDQYSIGYYRNLKGNIFETSAEIYYKDINNIVEYKDGANLILQNNLETELVSGIGRAYGVELYVKKNLGRLTGWASYTYSRTLRRIITPFEEEQINNGEWFPSNFDKPHDLTLVGNYKVNSYVSLSGNFSYSTGRPVTFPQAKFDFGRNVMAHFEDRNLERIPDFHRLDLTMTFRFNTMTKLLAGDWAFTVMNVYGRRNPFSVFFDDVQGAPPQAFRLAILGVPIPTLSYTVKI